MIKRMTTALLFALMVPCITSSQVQNNLAQQMELSAEMKIDYAILNARLANNQREYSIQTFCTARLTEPALSARKNYCNQKAMEFNNKDADLRAQLQRLTLAIQQLDAQIRQLQKPPAKRQ